MKNQQFVHKVWDEADQKSPRKLMILAASLLLKQLPFGALTLRRFVSLADM